MQAAVKEAIRLSGGIGAVGRALGVTPQAVHKWIKGGIPAERAVRLADLSGVALHDLRPDLFPPSITVHPRSRTRKRA